LAAIALQKVRHPAVDVYEVYLGARFLGIISRCPWDPEGTWHAVAAPGKRDLGPFADAGDAAGLADAIEALRLAQPVW
jgi:hypothetical protein